MSRHVKGRPCRPCRDCKEKPADLDSSGRCEACWAKAAGRWVWDGLKLNAFPHQARRGKAARRWGQLSEWPDGNG
jgi:hypothetical protein